MADITASTEDLLFRGALDLAGLVRAGEVSARDLVEASLARIDALNPELNAFVDVFSDEAIAAAAAIGPGDARPFAGVPIAIKNNRAIAGRRMTYCADYMGDWIAPYDHNVVTRLRAAGFVVVGSTTLPEWGILPWTNTKRFGATRNPWDPARTSGGSSGGSATAVASGMVPIAHANDGGGSTRIPAACCGLVGLKPQRNRISLSPEIGQSFLATDGVLTRTVADTAAALDVLAGPEVGDAAWAPPPDEPFAVSAARAPERLRVAVTVSPPLDVPVEAERAQAARDAGALLAALGHDVEEADPPWRRPRLGELFMALFAPLVMLQVAQARMIAGREPAEDDMEPLSWALWQRVGRMSGARRAPRVRAARDLRPRPAALDGRLRRDRHALAVRGAGAHRRGRLADGRPDGPVRPLGRVHAVHGDGERHRAARDLAADVRARGPSGRRPAVRAAGAGGRAAGGRGAARGRAAVGGPPPADGLTEPPRRLPGRAVDRGRS